MQPCVAVQRRFDTLRQQTHNGILPQTTTSCCQVCSLRLPQCGCHASTCVVLLLTCCVLCLAQENERRELLQMSDPQLADVARVCNRYPDIEVNFDVTGGETVTAGEPVQINVFMERTLPEGQDLAPVHCPRCVSGCYFTMLLSAAVLLDMPLHSPVCEIGLHAQCVAPCHVPLVPQQRASHHVVWSL